MNRPMKATYGTSGSEVDVKSTPGGILHNIPHKVIWTAKGYGWQVLDTTAVACLIVAPTTVAIGTFYNNTAKNFVIERVTAFNLISIANGQFGIWLCSHPTGMTAPTNDITVRNSTIGLAAGTEGIYDRGAAVINNGWYPWGESKYSVTATVPGTLATAEVDGRIIVPPTGALSVSCVGQTAVITVQISIHYFSVPTSELVLG